MTPHSAIQTLLIISIYFEVLENMIIYFIFILSLNFFVLDPFYIFIIVGVTNFINIRLTHAIFHIQVCAHKHAHTQIFISKTYIKRYIKIDLKCVNVSNSIILILTLYLKVIKREREEKKKILISTDNNL